MGARRKAIKNSITPPARNMHLGRLRGVLVLIGIVGGVFGGASWWLAQPGTLPIQRVQVEGEFRYLGKEDLYAAIGDLSSGGFFNVDVGAVKRAAESLPWVQAVSVRRQWPDTLLIGIREQLLLARWGQTQMVNIEGELFQPELIEQSIALPRFNGPSGTSGLMAARYQLLAEELAIAGLEIAELHLSERRAWEVQLDNGLRVVLGRSFKDTQLRRFTMVYLQALAAKAAHMESVDLRYSNGFAVRWETQMQEEKV